MTLSGLYQGKVVSTADPTKEGRVRLQVPQVSGRSMTTWAPPAQVGGRVPDVGETVWVMYQGGDSSYPTYVPPIPPPPVIPPPPQPFPPLSSTQVSEPDYPSGVGVTVAFTEAQWPSISFSVPPSGKFIVTVTGRVRSIVSSTSTAWMTWKMTGGHNEEPNGNWGLSCMNNARHQASMRYTITHVAAGTSISIVPCWTLSSYSAGNVQISQGQITVERVGTT